MCNVIDNIFSQGSQASSNTSSSEVNGSRKNYKRQHKLISVLSLTLMLQTSTHQLLVFSRMAMQLQVPHQESVIQACCLGRHNHFNTPFSNSKLPFLFLPRSLSLIPASRIGMRPYCFHGIDLCSGRGCYNVLSNVSVYSYIKVQGVCMHQYARVTT